MNLQEAENIIIRGIKIKKKAWSGRGPRALKVWINGNAIKFHLVADFTNLDIYNFTFNKKHGMLELWSQEISDEVIKPDMLSVVQQLSPELEIVSIHSTFSGKNFEDQITTLTLSKSVSDI